MIVEILKKQKYLYGIRMNILRVNTQVMQYTIYCINTLLHY